MCGRSVISHHVAEAPLRLPGWEGGAGGGNRESRPACLACSHLRGLTLQVSSEFLSTVLELCSLPPSVAGRFVLLPQNPSHPCAPGPKASVPPVCVTGGPPRLQASRAWLRLFDHPFLLPVSDLCQRLLPGLQFSDERRLPLGGFSDSVPSH